MPKENKQGVSVVITGQTTSYSDSKITDVSGNVSFPNIPVDNYSVNVILPSNDVFAPTDVENAIVDSNAGNNVLSALPYTGVDVVVGTTSNVVIVIENLPPVRITIGYVNLTTASVKATLLSGVNGTTNKDIIVNIQRTGGAATSNVTVTIPPSVAVSNEANFTIDFVASTVNPLTVTNETEGIVVTTELKAGTSGSVNSATVCPFDIATSVGYISVP